MMNIDMRWLFAIALGAAAGAAVTSRVLRRRQQMAQHHEHVEDLKAWENEGGNLAPGSTGSTLAPSISSSSAMPAHV